MNLADFNILATRFGTVLAADGAAQRTGERLPPFDEGNPFAPGDRRGRDDGADDEDRLAELG